MNLTFRILTVVIPLCMIVTVQAGGSKGASSSGVVLAGGSSSPDPKKSCLEWITDIYFKENDIETNKRIAENLNKLAPEEWNKLNIWPRSYAEFLVESKESLLPGVFCELFGLTIRDIMPNITPADFKTCPYWISLSGYLPFDRYGFNYNHSQYLAGKEVVNILSNCATFFANYLYNAHRGNQDPQQYKEDSEEEGEDIDLNRSVISSNPDDFCHYVLSIPPNTEVSFFLCGIPVN